MFPDVAFGHFCYIGGFSLCVFAVATRVIFSHCHASTFLTQSYRPFSIAMGLMTLGLLTRFSTDILLLDWSHHGYAGISWLLGLLLWSATVLRRCLVDTLAT